VTAGDRQDLDLRDRATLRKGEPGYVVVLEELVAVVEREVRERVDDDGALVDLYSRGLVGVMPENDIGPGVDHLIRELALFLVAVLVLQHSPVEVKDYEST
jgi:hypothetical protein